MLLGWQIGFRLTLAGIAGLIVAIGITADSFIVYFERIRDEIRDGQDAAGRPSRPAGRGPGAPSWPPTSSRSWPPCVLYFLSVGGVRGFAFTLGLTTLVDIVVVFMFTKPLVTILARTKFFGQGHQWSGLDPERLGAKRPPTPTPPPAPVAGTAASTATSTARRPDEPPRERSAPGSTAARSPTTSSAGARSGTPSPPSCC